MAKMVIYILLVCKDYYMNILTLFSTIIIFLLDTVLRFKRFIKEI